MADEPRSADTAPPRESAPASKSQPAANQPDEETVTKTYNPGEAPTKDAPNGKPYEGVSPEFQR